MELLTKMTELDFTILDYIHSTFSCTFLDKVMPVITSLGNAGLVWIAAGVIMLFFKRYRKAGFTMLVGLLVGFLLGNLLIKNLVARPRPFELDPTIQLLITAPTDRSFPSGHTLSSACAATVLFRSRREIGKAIGIAAIVLACLIAFSRLYLQVHFPSDVLGGAAIGIAVGFFTFKAVNSVIDSKKKSHGKTSHS